MAPAIEANSSDFSSPPWADAPVTQPGSPFRVFAPNAVKVSLLGDFSNWNPLPMTGSADGWWTCPVSNAQVGDAYQFEVTTSDGKIVRKSDPRGIGLQPRPLRASVLCDLSYRWKDASWMRHRRTEGGNTPLYLYQLDLLSWRRNAQDGLLPLSDLAGWLIPYVKRLGCTHVQFALPSGSNPGIADSIGPFAFNPDLGTPRDFMQLVDELHCAGLGVILEWDPLPLSSDPCGLQVFDGTCLYEVPGTAMADLQIPHTRQLLTDAAIFWAGQYHLDGLCFSRADDLLENLNEHGLWITQLNRTLHQNFSEFTTIGCFTSKEEASDPEGIPSLGFDLIWDLHWQSGILRYCALDPARRWNAHANLTQLVAPTGAASRVLPFSLDLAIQESLTTRMYGEDDARKMSAARSFFLYMLTCPGKKLLSMGSEFSQFSPWNPRHSLDWHLLPYPPCGQQLDFFQQAGSLYLSSPALWNGEGAPGNFQWICSDDASGNTLSYLRTDNTGHTLAVVFNFSGINRRSLPIDVPLSGNWRVLLNTDDARWGGNGHGSYGTLHTVQIPDQRGAQSLFLNISPLSAIVLEAITND